MLGRFENVYHQVLDHINSNKEAELEGYLWKTGPKSNKYEKRFCQLRGNIVNYYRKVREHHNLKPNIIGIIKHTEPRNAIALGISNSK